MYKQLSQRAPQSNQRNFLQRFQGRTSTIGKAGLLSILDNTNSPPKISHQGLNRYIDEGKAKPRQQSKPLQFNRFSINLNSNDDNKRSSNQSFKTEPRRSMGSMSQLGSTNKLRKQQSYYQKQKYQLGGPSMSSANLREEKKGSVSEMEKSHQKQIDSWEAKKKQRNGNDEKFKHLQFLNMFQERIKKRERK